MTETVDAVVLSRVARESDAVLMDLREFFRQNAGCRAGVYRLDSMTWRHVRRLIRSLGSAAAPIAAMTASQESTC
jgi:hypothetical protein